MATLPPIPQQAPMTNKDGTASPIWARFYQQVLTAIGAIPGVYPLSISNGGTGQSSQQSAINALTGAQTPGKYLRSDGTNSSLAAIHAADVPTLNQNTTGTAANITGTAAIGNGGTGQTTANAALNALLPSQTGKSGDYLTTDGTSTSWAAISTSSAPSGAMMAYGGSSAPSGWLFCDGSAVSRTTYSALFTAIGTGFGSGDGSTTFNLPNTSGVFLRGAGSQTISGISHSGTLGATQGDQIQGHVHQFTTQGGSGSYSGGSVGSDGGTANTGGPLSDGTNGTPRTGSETRPANIGVNWMIKT